MKQLIITLLILLVGFTSCVKDEDLKEPTQISADTPLFINEVVSTGTPDYVEIYNSSDESIDLAGYTISDGGADFLIPSGVSIEGKGYLVFLADDLNIVDASGIHTNFKISSGGEIIKFADAEGKLIDQIDLPPMTVGTALGRTTDGGDIWDLILPSPGAANSNENVAPIITTDTITALDDNTAYEISALVIDFSGLREVKVFYSFNGSSFLEDMAPIGGNEYVYKLPMIQEGMVLEYYIMAADESGLKTYFPETAPSEGVKVAVTNGFPVLSNFEISNANPGGGEDVTIKIDAFDVTGFDEVRLYYVFGDMVADDKIKIAMENIGGNTYQGVIPGQANNTVVKYYIRGEDLAGFKSYYPLNADFNNDLLEMWPSYVVAPPVILEALVMNELQGGGSPDFIELFNGTNADIDLGGYKLHDSDPTEAYEIPAGTIIPAGGFWVLDCDGSAVTLFKISSGGEDITLLDPSGNIVDQLLQADWPANHNALVGRNPDGAESWSVLDTETKGSSNNN